MFKDLYLVDTVFVMMDMLVQPRNVDYKVYGKDLTGCNYGAQFLMKFHRYNQPCAEYCIDI